MKINRMIKDLMYLEYLHGNVNVKVVVQDMDVEYGFYMKDEKVSFIDSHIDYDNNDDDSPVTTTINIYGESLKESK